MGGSRQCRVVARPVATAGSTPAVIDRYVPLRRYRMSVCAGVVTNGDSCRSRTAGVDVGTLAARGSTDVSPHAVGSLGRGSGSAGLRRGAGSTGQPVLRA